MAANGIELGTEKIIGDVSRALFSLSDSKTYFPLDVFDIIHQKYQENNTDCNYKHEGYHLCMNCESIDTFAPIVFNVQGD